MDKKVKELTQEMKRSWLVQRLVTPMHVQGDSPLAKLGPNPFSFGGGLRNGGLTDEARKMLGDVFDFDYMGSSEFEWGAVPEALAKIVDHIDQYGWYSEPIDYRYTEWRSGKIVTGTTHVYILCPEIWKEEVIKRIKEWALDQSNGMKENPMVACGLSGKEKYHHNLKGWLELDNGFMFFSDKKMFDKTMGLFGKD